MVTYRGTIGGLEHPLQYFRNRDTLIEQSFTLIIQPRVAYL